jgi:hypothetical protein
MPSDPPARLVHLRRFSYWLDEGIRLPGTGFRIGLDPILGLVPGFGDAAGAVLASAIVAEALRRGISRFTLIRMAANIALDALFGTVPLLGDFFDAAWKANLKNLALLERHIEVPTDARKADRTFVVLVCIALFVLCAGLIVGGALLTILVLNQLFS